MKAWFLVPLVGLLTNLVSAQPLPQPRLAYEDRPGPTGHTLVVDGKPWGPYKTVLAAAYSTSGTALAFAVEKRDRVVVLAQGKESGPLPSGFDLERLQVSDDGKVWVATATLSSSAEDEPNQTLVLVNGKPYGPYPELTTVEYAESGGAWMAAVRTAPEEADVLLNGKSQGPFFAVEHAWLSPDGKQWGYAVSDPQGRLTVVTNDKTWSSVDEVNFASLYPREPHWGWSLRTGPDDVRIVVDGAEYLGYAAFLGLVLTPSGRHWAFEAARRVGGETVPVVVVDGKEYLGEGIAWSRLGLQESFTWTVTDGPKVTVFTLRLP